MNAIMRHVYPQVNSDVLIIISFHFLGRNGWGKRRKTINKKIYTQISIPQSHISTTESWAVYYPGNNKYKNVQPGHMACFASFDELYLVLPQAGEDIVLNMTTTKAISTLNYLIISKGNIVKGDSISYSPSVTSSTLRIPSKRNMSPSANIVVYFVREDREIIADSLKIVVKGPFENMVSKQNEKFWFMPDSFISSRGPVS